MAKVKTFRINPEYGVPDKEIREWLSLQEKNMIVKVHTVFIPAIGTADPRLTVIVTKDDDIVDDLQSQELLRNEVVTS